LTILPHLYPLRPPALAQKWGKGLVWSMPSDDRKVYLTFDDGPHPEITSEVLSILDAFRWKATFFCIGQNILRSPETYSDLLSKGHTTANHTQTHCNGWKTDTSDYLQNTLQAQSHGMSTLFRPPYGKITPAQIRSLRSQYTIVMWSMITGDYDHSLPREKTLQKLNNRTKAGDIVVFHDSVKAKQNLLYLLPRYLEYLCQNDFKPGCFSF
jgi:peptidoglycan-N-acetylglucosamine deacetylase